MNKKPNYYKVYNIPKSIFVFAHKIDIIFDEKLADDYNYNGLADYNKGTITLQPDCKGFHRTPEAVKTTFWYEVIHFVFRTLGDEYGYEKLTDDKSLVSLVGYAIHQVIDTAKY